MDELKDKIQLQGLVVSRIPSWAKDYIKERAKEEFSDDYGQAIAYFIKMATEYENLKYKFLNSELPIKIGLDTPQVKEEEAQVTRSINGEPIKRIGGRI